MTNPQHPYSRRVPARLLVFFIAAALPFVLAAQDNLGRGRVTGQVLDEAGAPIEGAKVVAESLQGTAKLDGTTNRKGNFAIGGLGTGRWRITASKEGYVEAFTEMNISQIRPNPPVALTLRKAAASAGLRADSSSLAALGQGNALLEKGDCDGALVLFQEFQSKYPAIYQVRLNIGSAYLKKGETDKAESEYKGVLADVIRVKGDYGNDKATASRALAGLGEIALKKGDLEAGQKYFTEALAVSPEDEAAAYNVGEMLFSNQKVDESIKFFELAIQIKKDWPKPYYKLGLVYLNKGDMARSLECFNKFVALDPSNPEVPGVKNIIATIEKMKK
jgi:tetratricopeptide (TPR) repeat protein